MLDKNPDARPSAADIVCTIQVRVELPCLADAMASNLSSALKQLHTLVHNFAL